MMHELTEKIKEARSGLSHNPNYESDIIDVHIHKVDQTIREWLMSRGEVLLTLVNRFHMDPCSGEAVKVEASHYLKAILGLDEKKEWCEHMKPGKVVPIPPPKFLADRHMMDLDCWKFCPICGAKRP